MATNEVQKITFSTAPAYGRGTFTGPDSESIVVDFEQNLAAEQAAFTAAMATNYPTVARPSSLIHTFTFATGSNAGLNIDEMTFTPNTTTFPLNDGTSTATLVKTQEGDSGGGIPTIYTLTWVGACGWVTISGTNFVRGSLPATANLGGFDWDIAGSGATFTLTTQQNTNATLTLDASKVGAAVTGTMSTTTHGYPTPVWYQCQDAVLDALQAMATAGDLPGIASASIIAVEQPQVKRFFGTGGVNSQLDYPGIMVCPYTQEMTDIAAGANLVDEIVYPISISFVDKGAGVTGTSSMVGSDETRAKHMYWREKVSRKFRHFLCADITEIRDVYIRPGVYAAGSTYQSDDLYHGAIVVDFYSRETRDNSGG